MLPFAALALVNLLVLRASLVVNLHAGVLTFGFGLAISLVGVLMVMRPAARGVQGRLTAPQSLTARRQLRNLSRRTLILLPVWALATLLILSGLNDTADIHLGPLFVILWAPVLTALGGYFGSLFFQEIHDAVQPENGAQVG